MVYARLYLPKGWNDNPERCKIVGIPEEQQKFRTKLDILHEIILRQLEIGTSFDFIRADGCYGNEISLAEKIDKLSKIYMLTMAIRLGHERMVVIHFVKTTY